MVSPPSSLPLAVRRLVDLALEEDIGPGDLTSLAVIPEGHRAVGRLVAREPLVLSGLDVAALVFERVDGRVVLEPRCQDGTEVCAEEIVAEVSGPTQALLAAERTALNFLQRLSGVATLTRRYVEALAGSGTRLTDTRKTTPGWRWLEKRAVRHGGGLNHRFALYDGILIKDNHLAAAGDLETAIARARRRASHLAKIEVEVDSIEQIEPALRAGADLLLLDNMDDETLARAVARVGGRVPTEASGGITLERLPAVAKAGVSFVSCGAITHGARAVDLAFDLALEAAEPSADPRGSEAEAP